MSFYRSSIEKSEVNELPVIQFTGQIVLVQSPEELRAAIDEIKKERILGFDTETRPSFKRGEKHHVSILQLASFSKAWIIRLKGSGLSNELSKILEDDTIVKIGAAIRDDLKALNYWKNFTPAGFIDLQNYVKNYGIEDCSLQKIAAIVLNSKISKSQQVTNWDNLVLTEKQMIYAATDAWVSLEIYQKLRSNQ